mmetsp:Transcript_12087/g.27085  ORF Transcript_12087/g.27085 Transcript_12087/m.27085 type:complete len:220 (+) Transcript_12087:470-1129(+)
MVRCDLADFLDVSLLLLLEADPSERTVLLVAPLSFSKTALRKSGSPKSSESCLRKCAAPSRKAWLVFSTALRSPMSDQRPVSGFLSKKRPAGSIDRIASTMEREIAIFCFLVLVTYNSVKNQHTKQTKSWVRNDCCFSLSQRAFCSMLAVPKPLSFMHVAREAITNGERFIFWATSRKMWHGVGNLREISSTAKFFRHGFSKQVPLLFVVCRYLWTYPC